MSDIKAPKKPEGYVAKLKKLHSKYKVYKEKKKVEYEAKLERDTMIAQKEAKYHSAVAQRESARARVSKARAVSSPSSSFMGGNFLGGMSGSSGGDSVGMNFLYGSPTPKPSVPKMKKVKRVKRRKSKKGKKKKGRTITVSY